MRGNLPRIYPCMIFCLGEPVCKQCTATSEQVCRSRDGPRPLRPVPCARKTTGFESDMCPQTTAHFHGHCCCPWCRCRCCCCCCTLRVFRATTGTQLVATATAARCCAGAAGAAVACPVLSCPDCTRSSTVLRSWKDCLVAASKPLTSCCALNRNSAPCFSSCSCRCCRLLGGGCLAARLLTSYTSAAAAAAATTAHALVQ
jgi:hypothetical protein